MNLCKIPSCNNYAGKNCNSFCSWHTFRFDIRGIIMQEQKKLHGVGHPVKRTIVKEVRY